MEVVVVPEEVVPEYIVGTPSGRGTIAAGNSRVSLVIFFRVRSPSIRRDELLELHEVVWVRDVVALP